MTVRADNPWQTREMRDERRQCRQLERKKKKTVHLQAKVADNEGKRSYFNIGDTFLLKKPATKLPLHIYKKELVERFNDFYISKIVDIPSSLDAIPCGRVSVDEFADDIERRTFSHFSPVSVDTVASLIMSWPKCSLDPVPTFIVKRFVEFLAPSIAHLVNASLASVIFPSSMKHALVTPLIKLQSLQLQSDFHSCRN